MTVASINEGKARRPTICSTRSFDTARLASWPSEPAGTSIVQAAAAGRSRTRWLSIADAPIRASIGEPFARQGSRPDVTPRSHAAFLGLLGRFAVFGSFRLGGEYDLRTCQ